MNAGPVDGPRAIIIVTVLVKGCPFIKEVIDDLVVATKSCPVHKCVPIFVLFCDKRISFLFYYLLHFFQVPEMQ